MTCRRCSACRHDKPLPDAIVVLCEEPASKFFGKTPKRFQTCPAWQHGGRKTLAKLTASVTPKGVQVFEAAVMGIAAIALYEATSDHRLQWLAHALGFMAVATIARPFIARPLGHVYEEAREALSDRSGVARQTTKEASP